MVGFLSYREGILAILWPYNPKFCASARSFPQNLSNAKHRDTTSILLGGYLAHEQDIYHRTLVWSTAVCLIPTLGPLKQSKLPWNHREGKLKLFNCLFCKLLCFLGGILSEWPPESWPLNKRWWWWKNQKKSFIVLSRCSVDRACNDVM